MVAGSRSHGASGCASWTADLQHPPELIPTLLLKPRRTRRRNRRREPLPHRGPCRRSAAGSGPDLPGAAALARVDVPARTAHAVGSDERLLRLPPQRRRRRRAPTGRVQDPARDRGASAPAARSPRCRTSSGSDTPGASKASTREGLAYARHLSRLRLKTRPARSRRAVHHYDIHGIIGVESEGRAPRARVVPGRRRSTALPTCAVRIGPPAGRRPRRSRIASRATCATRERTGNLGFAADITLGDHVEVLAAPLLRHSPHVLYTNLVEPILRWEFARRGYALAHGACVVHGNDAFMITARTDTGKTTTMLKLLDAQPYRVHRRRSHDRAARTATCSRIRSRSRSATTRCMRSSARFSTGGSARRCRCRAGSTRGPVGGSRSSSSRPGMPVATVNTLVQLLVPPPKYPVQRLVPAVEIAKGAKLAGLLVIQRSGDGFEWLERRRTRSRSCSRTARTHTGSRRITGSRTSSSMRPSTTCVRSSARSSPVRSRGFRAALLSSTRARLGDAHPGADRGADAGVSARDWRDRRRPGSADGLLIGDGEGSGSLHDIWGNTSPVRDPRTAARRAVRSGTWSWARLKRFARFGIVGASGFVVNEVALALFVSTFSVNYLVGADRGDAGIDALELLALRALGVPRHRCETFERRTGCCLFFMVNNAALLLRGPILVVLTSGLGLNYLVSNLVSLGVLTVVRFAVADNWIWAATGTARRARLRTITRRWSGTTSGRRSRARWRSRASPASS